MSSLAPTLEGFFTERLMRQRHASPNTVAAYRDTFCLLLGYLRVTTGKALAGWTSKTWMRQPSPASCSIWRSPVTTAFARATPG